MEKHDLDFIYEQLKNKYDLSSLPNSGLTFIYNTIVSVMQAERDGLTVEEMIAVYEEELVRRGLGDRVKEMRKAFHFTTDVAV